MKSLVAVSALIALLLGGLFAVSRAQEQPAIDQGLPQGFPDVVRALKETPGCLGVETARTGRGKRVVFAWFENKKGLLNWYQSDTHREAMKKYFGLEPSAQPLKNVPETSDPILAIATFTVADKSRFKETALPVSQLSIEFYQPLAGGISVGGRFAPESLKVPKMRDYTPNK